MTPAPLRISPISRISRISPILRRLFALAAIFLLYPTPPAHADADGDWQQIQSMDTQGPGQQWQNPDQARAGAIEYLGTQEKALRAFIDTWPDDSRIPDAKLRLAHLLASRADLEQDPALNRASNSILDELEADPAMKTRRADIAFARISIFMQRVDSTSGANRDPLLDKARDYAAQFPDDRRVAPLLTDVASAFEDEPKTARALLTEALPKAQTPELRARIGDDLKRLDLLGKPLDMKWTGIDGKRMNLDQMHGKVVLIYFFATWSGPSMIELDWVQQIVARTSSDTLQAIGISLDSDPVPVASALSDHQVTWPVYCDGQGWKGELVRSLGVNAIPDLWIVDRNGILRTLDAKDNAVQLIEKAAGQ